MKLKLYFSIIMLFGICQIAKTQTWEPLGPDDFLQLSYGAASDMSIAFNGSVPYVAYRYNGNSDKATVMKLNAGGTAWELVGTAGFSTGQVA